MPCLQILFCITYAIFHTHGTCAPIHFQIYGLSLKPPKAPSTLSQKNVCIPYIQYYVWTYRSGEKEKKAITVYNRHTRKVHSGQTETTKSNRILQTENYSRFGIFILQ